MFVLSQIFWTIPHFVFQNIKERSIDKLFNETLALALAYASPLSSKIADNRIKACM